MTAIEICDRKIRLVRWLDDDDRAAPKEVAVAEMRDVMAAVGAAG